MLPDPSRDLRDIEKHTAFLRRIALRLAGRDHADDLVQETLLVGMTRPPREAKSISGWLVGVMRRLFLENRRSDSRRRERERSSVSADSGIDPARVVDHRALLSALTRSMCALAKDQYEVLMLRYFDGLSPTEIAAKLDLPLSNVKRRLDRAMSRMRDELGREEPRWRSMIVPFLGISKWAAADLAAATGTAKIGTLGAMAVAKKSMAAALVFLIVGLGIVWFVESKETSDPSIGGAGIVADGAAATSLPRRSADPSANEAESRVTEPEASLDPLAAADRDLDIFGVVVDEGDRPIAGARVRALRLLRQRVGLANMDGYYEAKTTGEATTDAAGRFILRHRRGELVDLDVSANGFARRTYRRRTAGERCRIVLPKACPFAIRVVDEEGTPLAGATLEVRGMTDDATNRRAPTGDRRRGVTGSDGLFAIDDLFPSSITVEAEHPRYGARNWFDFSIGTPGEVFTIALSIGTVLKGRVVDGETGVGLAGAKVGEGWTLSRAVMTDENGFFELFGWVGEATMEIAARADGYGAEEILVGTAPGELIFRMTRGNDLSGRIIDRRGRSIEASLVTAWAIYNAGRSVDSKSTKTDALGRFRLRGLRPEVSHKLVLQADGFGRSMFLVDRPQAGTSELELGDIALDDALTIEGRVIDGDGAPLEDVGIELFGTNADIGRLTGSGSPGERAFDYGCEENRRTDDLGRFRFPDLAAGRYRLTASLRGQASIVEMVDLPADGLARPIEMKFPKSKPLTVSVVDDRGRPVQKIDLDLVRSMEHSFGSTRVQTNENGEAQFFGVADGERFAIEVLYFGQPFVGETTHRFKRDRDRFVVKLQRGERISGKAIFVDGRAAVGFRIVAVGENDAEASVLTEKDGTFSVLVSPGATYRMQCFGRRSLGEGGYETTRFRGVSAPVAAPADGVVVELSEIAVDRRLTVRVELTDGRPAENAHVFLTRFAAGQISADANDEGIAIFEGLAAESVRLSADRDDLGADEAIPAPVEVLPDGQVVRLRFRTTRVHEGSVLTADGRAAGGATIEAIASDGSEFGAVADAEGQFKIPLVGDLEYRFNVVWTGPDGEIGRTKIAARSPKDLDFRLDPE